MQESEEAKAESSEIAQEQDKNQTSISRMQSDSRSETGIKKILTGLESLETLYRLQGSRSTHLDNCTERENAKSERSKQRKAKQHSERGLQTFWKVIKLIRAQGGCPGTDCRRRT